MADLRTLQGANVNHPELEVHGSADNNGVIHATFIHKWADDNVAGRDVQVRGTVAGPPTATTFVIGRKTVDYTGLTGGVVPAGVIAGSFVEVKGTLRVSDNVLVATVGETGGRDRRPAVRQQGGSGGVRQPGGDAERELRDDRPERDPDRDMDHGDDGVYRGHAERTSGAGVKVEVEGTRKVGGALAATKIEIRRASNIRIGERR